MGISSDVVTNLRSEGHDATHLAELGLERMEDAAILALAVSEQRIVLAHDLDMSRIMALGGATAPSVLSFRLSNMTPASVLRHLHHAVSAFKKELQQGAIVAVTDIGARCHILPIIRPPSSET
jgi:predicted nuclease of predicted toxin-antitoxin system